MSEFDNSTPPLVQFLVGGVQKGGTTALHDMLYEHPDIYLPKIKELHFFDRLSSTSSTELDYSRYHNHFESRKMGQLCGETTPSYIYFSSVAEHVLRYNPKMKWIILLRNPALRAFSQWNMAKNKGVEPLTFEEALAYAKDKSLDLPANKNRRYGYADRSRYAGQIKNLLEYFPRNQCLFLKSESLRANANKTLNTIVQFLGISELQFNHRISHAGAYNHRTPSDESVLRKLNRELQQDISETEALTGLDLSDWLNDYS